MVEKILEDYERAYGLRYCALRYFNAAGCDPETEIGEWHDPETHLIPLVLDAASGRRDAIYIFGTDYPTPDGTCIRDYIHVSDLADAHVRALRYIKEHDRSEKFNLGNGKGFSVREIIDVAKDVTGRDINAIESPRRAGDPPELIGSAEKARRILGWQPAYDLRRIMETAWAWQQRLYRIQDGSEAW